MTLERLHELITNLNTEDIIIEGKIVLPEDTIPIHYNKRNSIGNFFSVPERDHLRAALQESGQDVSLIEIYEWYDLDSFSFDGSMADECGFKNSDGVWRIYFTLDLSKYF